jgi:hypothetical protein
MYVEYYYGDTLSGVRALQSAEFFSFFLIGQHKTHKTQGD